MQRFNNEHLSHEFPFSEQSSIRRYYVETSSVSRRPNLDTSFQDNPDSLKFYVVARRNYSAPDLPFVVPTFFSHFNTGLGLFGGLEGVSNDFFDRGVTTTDDSDILDDSPFPLRPRSPSKTGSIVPKVRKRVSEAGVGHEAADFFDQPFEDGLNRSEEAEYVASESPRRTSDLNLFDTQGSSQAPSPAKAAVRRSLRSPLKLARGSLRRPVGRPKGSSPVRLSGNFNRTLSLSDRDLAAPGGGLLELEDLKSSRGSSRSRGDKSRPIRASATTNSLYRLDRKGAAGPKKAAVRESKDALKISKRGPYQIVRGPRRIVGLPKPAPESGAKVPRKRGRPPKKKLPLPAVPDKAELVEADYDLGGLDPGERAPALEDLKPDAPKLGAVARVRRRPRPSVSSSDLLNSWYVTTRRESDESEWVYAAEPEARSSRYPQRFRRPPSQHWISNVTSDGASVLFVASVATEPSRRLGHSGDARPECSSLVLTNDHGEVKLQVVDQDAPSSPGQKSITDYLKTLGTVGAASATRRAEDGPLRIADAARPPGRPRKVTRRLVKRSRQLSLEDSSSSPESARGERSKPPAKRVKRRLVKVKRSITAEDALELLSKLPEVYDGGKTLDIEFDEESEGEGRELARERERRLRRFHAKFLKENNKFDSFVEHGSDGIYYRTLYRRDQNEALHGELVFNPMIFTSQCRTSDVRIPGNKFLDFGDVQSNFIFGYVYSGADIVIRGAEEEKPLGTGEFFCLPTEKSWVIENNSSSLEASIALTVVNV